MIKYKTFYLDKTKGYYGDWDSISINDSNILNDINRSFEYVFYNKPDRKLINILLNSETAKIIFKNLEIDCIDTYHIDYKLGFEKLKSKLFCLRHRDEPFLLIDSTESKNGLYYIYKNKHQFFVEFFDINHL